jgi:hypothetical protein
MKINMDVCNTGLVLAQCRILRCLQGKKNVIQKNFAARFAGIHRRLSTLAKRNISTAKNNAENEQKKHTRKPVFAPKKRFLGGILRFTLHLLINKGDQNILPGVYFMLCNGCEEMLMQVLLSLVTRNTGFRIIQKIAHDAGDRTVVAHCRQCRSQHSGIAAQGKIGADAQYMCTVRNHQPRGD